MMLHCLSEAFKGGEVGGDGIYAHRDDRKSAFGVSEVVVHKRSFQRGAKGDGSGSTWDDGKSALSARGVEISEAFKGLTRLGFLKTSILSPQKR